MCRFQFDPHSRWLCSLDRSPEASKSKDGSSRAKRTQMINKAFIKDGRGKLITNFEDPFFRQIEEHVRTKFMKEQTAGHATLCICASIV